MIKLPDIKDLDPGTTLTPICREVFIWGANFAIAEVQRLNATAKPVRDGCRVPEGWKLVPIEPTENMLIHGFESEPDEIFSDHEDWEKYQEMTGCQQAEHRARLCWNAMLKAAPEVTDGKY